MGDVTTTGGGNASSSSGDALLQSLLALRESARHNVECLVRERQGREIARRRREWASLREFAAADLGAEASAFVDWAGLEAEILRPGAYTKHVHVDVAVPGHRPVRATYAHMVCSPYWRRLEYDEAPEDDDLGQRASRWAVVTADRGGCRYTSTLGAALVLAQE